MPVNNELRDAVAKIIQRATRDCGNCLLDDEAVSYADDILALPRIAALLGTRRHSADHDRTIETNWPASPA